MGFNYGDRKDCLANPEKLTDSYEKVWQGTHEVVMRTILLTVMLLTMAVVAEAQWVYITPPWNFDHHPKYDGTTARSIPLGDWEQLAAFDSAAKCEKGRIFAREIRYLTPLERERLLALLAFPKNRRNFVRQTVSHLLRIGCEGNQKTQVK